MRMLRWKLTLRWSVLTPNARRTAVQIDIRPTFLRIKKNLKETHTLFKSSFDPTLEFTLDPELDLELPLQLDDGLFSAFCPCLDFEFDLDDPLLPFVDTDPDLFKLRLRLAVLDASASPSNPTSGTGTCSRCCTRSCWRMSGT